MPGEYFASYSTFQSNTNDTGFLLRSDKTREHSDKLKSEHKIFSRKKNGGGGEVGGAATQIPRDQKISTFLFLKAVFSLGSYLRLRETR